MLLLANNLSYFICITRKLCVNHISWIVGVLTLGFTDEKCIGKMEEEKEEANVLKKFATT